MIYSFAVLLATSHCLAEAFVGPHQSVDASRTFSNLAAKTTLNDETSWKIRINMNGISTEQGKKVDDFFVVEAQFIEDEGYEPPQGKLRQVLPEDPEARVLKIEDSYWKLSEDPEDRKDGLWIWGLFKEPLYPYLLLQMKTAKLDIPGDGGDSVQPLTLYAQINHSRDDDKGVVLQRATLNKREIESFKADPFGGARVEIPVDDAIGQITIQAVEEIKTPIN